MAVEPTVPEPDYENAAETKKNTTAAVKTETKKTPNSKVKIGGASKTH